MQNRPRAPSWLPRTLFWVILATQTLLWAAAEAVSVQNLPRAKSSSWYERQGVPKGERLTSEPCPSADHILCPEMAALAGNGAESGVQVHESGEHHAHHPFSAQPLGTGAGPWLGLPPPCPLQFWQRVPKPGQQAGVATGPAPSKAVTAWIWPPCSPMAPGRPLASCSRPRCVTYLSLLALTHFFFSLLSQSAHMTLISNPKPLFPKANSTPSFANSFLGVCVLHEGFK